MTKRVPKMVLAAVLLPAAARGAAQVPEPASDAEASFGSVAIRAVQRTPGGPPVGEADVTVQLFHQGVVLETFETRLDEHGVVVLEGLPLRVPMQPVAQVVYKDLTYQVVGDVMDTANAEQALTVECYEPTEAEPDWSVSMWHVMVDRDREGLAVTEIVVVENPAEHTWVGTMPAARDPAGEARPVTTRFALPEHASHVTLQRGFHDWCCTSRDGAALANHLPLVPGSTEFKFSYHVHAAGATGLRLVTPAPVVHMMLLVSDELEVVSSGGLTPKGAAQVAGREIDAFTAEAVEAAAVIPVTLSISPLPGAGAATGGDEPDVVGLVRTIAAIGAGTLVVAAVIIMLRRPRHNASEPHR